MKEQARHIDTDLVIIGSGMAGFAAAVFARNRQIDCAQVGNTGALAYTTGYLDLLGSLDDSPDAVNDPWQGLTRLQKLQPKHPLCGISEQDIRTALSQFTGFLKDSGIDYSTAQQSNITALTPAGTLKKTLCVPATMAAGPAAMAEKRSCTIIDFRGLKGFSARQVVANLQDLWPGLSAERLIFPGMESGEIYPEVVARALEVPATRRQLAPLLVAAAGKSKIIGLPALLGMHRPDEVHADLQRLTGLTLFEIPTMPPSVPGIRLRELFEQVLPKKGVRLIAQQKVEAAIFAADRIHLSLQDSYGPITIGCRAVILATGRFLSGGLAAETGGIRETLINLPVSQPFSRERWYSLRYTDPRGHAINKSGIEVDEQMRPQAQKGVPFDSRLFAAGSILAHQDWIRGRSGAGLAIATAYKAVEAAERFLGCGQDGRG